MDEYSYLGNADVSYIDELYISYKNDPDSVDESWKKFFQGFEFSQERYGENGHSSSSSALSSPKEIKVRNFIYAHRSRAHLKSDTNPVRERRPHVSRLQLEDFGLSENDFSEAFDIGEELGMGKAMFKEIKERLARLYLGHIGYEYNHIRNSDIFEWFKKKIETKGININPPDTEKKRILSKLTEAVVFENFLHTKFFGSETILIRRR